MADSNLTSLTAVASGGMTQIASSQFYVVDNGTSKRISGDLLEARMIFQPGVLLVRSDPQPLPNAVFSPALWEGAIRNVGGWWSVNSASIVQVPNDDVAYIQIAFGAAFESITGGIRNITYLKNSSFGHDVGGRMELRWDASGAGNDRRFFTSQPIPVNSGDTFEAIPHHTQGTTVDLEPGTSTFFAVWPVGFK